MGGEWIWCLICRNKKRLKIRLIQYLGIFLYTVQNAGRRHKSMFVN
ncbi:hypothetical protein RUMHYD_01406 [Blautia hydrogenotrophica DSM 10507]|uniref:Uncharacterized protein n=1 Tax=Blautia hydrogenotrophica (strain DSM 10507 / JCM 14656 / S5a33) TaxID=476272 RepID=C0CKN6_BLAHS|nr:hypothetical protein RUMHYD_01406 [Blautia hydrogenotrophica DSM 10507]